MPTARLARPRPTGIAAATVAFLLAVSGCAAGGGDETAAAPEGAQPITATPTAPATPSPKPTGPDGEAEKDGTEVQTSAAQDVPESGSGRTTVVTLPGQDSSPQDRPGRVVRYTVEIEGGLEKVAAGFPEAVRGYLTDDRGWETRDGVRFEDVSAEERKQGVEPDIRIMFASPDLVDAKCAPLRTNGRLSCHHAGKVMVNAWRWVHGSKNYGEDLDAYRTYLVNHEVGHSLGHGHVACPGRGEKAPIMLQQTLRLDGCLPHPYPA
ncbi:DUF3152 domain-containing protein [Mobilicoccus caccae]|nr:DUF3152 domain-containing protein [Mobilicoccus caccae]